MSTLLFPQHFGWYVHRPSSGVCWTWEPTQNFELRPLLNHLFWVRYSVKYSYSPAVRIETATLGNQDWNCKLREPTPITIMLCVQLDSLECIFGTYKLNVLTWLGLLLGMYIFYLCSYSDYFFCLTFLIIGSYIVFISMLGRLSRSV